MGKVANDIDRIVREFAKSELRRQGKEIQDKLVKKTEEAMEKYYEYPESPNYDRTGMFGSPGISYRRYTESGFTGKGTEDLEIEVGVEFDPTYEYPRAGRPTSEIYSWNFDQGAHGRGKNGDIPRKIIEEYRDSLAD